jgi:hypothetical protein
MSKVCKGFNSGANKKSPYRRFLVAPHIERNPNFFPRKFYPVVILKVYTSGQELIFSAARSAALKVSIWIFAEKGLDFVLILILAPCKMKNYEVFFYHTGT